ncbi:hypothetical protein K439DRAFT_1364700, partial [Ramaria rubella]
YPMNSHYDTLKEQNGHKLYKQFRIVVLLEQQVQVMDVKWLEFLRHLRYDQVKEHHIQKLRRLVLTNKDCPVTNFENTEWKDVSLITPRHAVWTRWNAAMLQKHCKEMKHTLYICNVYDTISKQQLTLAERYAMQKGRETKNRLPDKIKLVLGMTVMVTTNVDTDLDVENGSWGVIVDIALNPREEKGTSGSIAAL